MNERALPDSAFVVLAVLAERPHHGYELQRVVHDRGFRFWTQLRRSATYNALQLLERDGLVTASSERGDGPRRKVYRISDRGRDALRAEGLRKLAAPANPHNEIDLAVYALPFLPADDVLSAMGRCRAHLGARAAFLQERLDWCTTRDLRIPALAFERPLVALRAEIRWLDKLMAEQATGAPSDPSDWSHYVYQPPPDEQLYDA